ncbi:AMP-binding protein [Pelagibius sp. CAU 1746]|uniref:class I adenylate-forming enzyme family protein n=1 Tax=Pelagibius sp. CAU 1746 TaxID=3140370 RepID=UPI00325BBD48
MNLYQTAAFHALRRPGKTAIVDGRSTFTFGDLTQRAQELAAFLEGKGVGRGDRVCVLMHNSIDQVALYHATALTGFILVPVNSRYDAEALIHVVSDCTPRVVLYEDDFAAVVGAARSAVKGPGPEWLAVSDEPPRGSPAFPALTRRFGAVSPDDVALILYTSGTTSLPKGAMLTHGNLVWNSINYLVELGISAESRAILATPLFHIGGFGVLNGPVLYAGGSLQVVPKFTPDKVIESLDTAQPTHLFLLSTMWVALTDSETFRGRRYADVAYIQTAAAPLSAWRQEIIRQVFPNAEFGWGFGMTETCVTTIKNRYTQEILDHPGSMGYVWRHVAYRVADADGRVADPVGNRGELQVKGPTVFAGYWNDPQATAAAFTQDGWLRTGDLLSFDQDGFASFRGRSKDMVKTGGENVAALEVENCLAEHPEVTESAVFGLPHEYWGEELVAAVVPKPGTEPDPGALREHCRSRLSAFKVPKRIFIVENLPHSASGKIQKFRLRERFDDAKDQIEEGKSA